MATLEEIRRQLGIQSIPNTSITTFGQSQQPQQQPQRPPARPPEGSSAAETLAALPSVNPPKDDGGLQSLSNVLGNVGDALGSVGSTVLSGVDKLQTAGRAGVAGAENLARIVEDSPLDFLPADRFYDTEKEDIGSWWERAADSEYGFGTALPNIGEQVGLDEIVGDQWANRLSGLAGDVITDPLTWITAGSAQAAGKSARIGLAAKAVKSGDAALAAKSGTIARKGVAYLSDSERALLGVEKSALRFAGVQLPATGRIARRTGKITSTMRHQTFGRRPWQYIARTPTGDTAVDLTEAYKVLNEANYQGTMTDRQASVLVAYDEAIRAKRKTAAVPAANAAEQVFKDMNEAQRRALTHSLEASGQNVKDVGLRAINQELKLSADKAGVVMGDLGEDWITHIWTKEGRRLLGQADVVGPDGQKIIVSLDPSAATMGRTFRKGTYVINDKPVTFKKGTIADIQATLEKAFPELKGVRLLEDDSRELTSRYIQMITEDIGNVAAFREMIDEFPDVYNWVDTVGSEVLDDIADATTNKAMAKELRNMLKQREEIFKVETARAKEDAAEIAAVVSSRFIREAEVASAEGRQFAQLVKDLKAKGKTLNQSKKELTKKAQALRVDAQRKLATVEEQYFKTVEELEAAQLRLATASSDKTRLAAFNDLAARRTALSAEVEQGRAAVAEIDRLTQELADQTRLEATLLANADNPDFIQTSAQDLVPDVERQVVRELGEAETKLNASVVRLETVNRKIEELETGVRQVGSRQVSGRSARELGDQEVARLGIAADTLEEAAVEARRAVDEAEEAVLKRQSNVARGVAQRGSKFAERKAKIVDRALKELDKLRGERSDLSRKWAVAGEEMRDAMKVADAAASDVRAARLADEAAGSQLRAIDEAAESFGRKATTARETGDALRRESREMYGNDLGFITRLEEDSFKAMDEAQRYLHDVWIARDEFAKLTTARRASRQAAERATGEARRTAEGQLTRAVASTPENVGLPVALQKKIAAAEQAYEAALNAVPEPERKLLEAIDNLHAKASRAKAIDGSLRNVQATLRKAERLSTPERQLKALRDVQQILEQTVKANPDFYKRQVETVTELIPGPQLGARADLERRLGDLTVEPLELGKEARAGVRKAQVKGKIVSHRDINRFVDEGELAAAPAEVAARWAELQQLGADVDLEEARRLAEFIGRHKRAVDAGETPSDALSARVLRSVYQSEKDRLDLRVDELSSALDAPAGSKRAVKAQRDELQRQLDDMGSDVLASRQQVETLRGVRRSREDLTPRARRLGRIKKADWDKLSPQEQGHWIEMARKDADASTRRIVGLGEAAYADSQELAFLTRQAREDLLARELTMDESLKAITGYGEEARDFRRELIDLFAGRSRRGEQVAATSARQERAFNKLFNDLTPETKERLLKDLRRELEDTRRAQRSATRSRDLISDEGVDADWRDLLLGDGSRPASMTAERSDIERQLGFFDEAQQNIREAAVAAGREADDLRGARRAQSRAAYRGSVAERELADLPPIQSAGREAISAASAEVDDLSARARTLSQAGDALDATLTRVDDAAADEMVRIDQMAEANATMAEVAGGQSRAAKARAARLKAEGKEVVRKAKSSDVKQAYDDLDAVVQALPDDPDLAPVFALHAAYTQKLTQVSQAEMSAKNVNEFLTAAKQGELTNGMAAQMGKLFGVDVAVPVELPRGWQDLGISGKMDDGVVGSFAAIDEIAPYLRNVKTAFDDPDKIGVMFDKWTQFFKTYATATPGFHLRNGISATFMNAANGVDPRSQRQAMSEWRKYLADPQGHMRRIKKSDPKLHEAFVATFGSGAGGNFSAAELGKSHNWLFDNKWTQLNRKLGEGTEGVVRLAYAIDTVQKGGTAYDAMRNITRTHFDYSQLSSLDRRIKRAIPFWTFLSRNLPLQLQMMWMRPGMYSAYNHAADNLGEDLEFMPQWLQERSGFVIDSQADGTATVLAPDLPHLNLAADLETFDLRNPERVLSNLNPMMVAPLETLSNTNYYYDNEIGDIGDRLQHLAMSAIPPVSQVERGSGGQLFDTERYQGRAPEKLLNLLGVPRYVVTPEQQQSEARRRAFEAYVGE